MKKQLHGRRPNLIASFVASALASAAAAPAWAQTSDATLTGRADPGTEVTVTNVATGLTRHTKAGSNGTYTLLGLPAGEYKVEGGGGQAQTVTLSVATTETLDLGKLETVVVSGGRIVETKTPEIGTIVSLQEIETVPQITRNFLEFADTVPGMVFKLDSSGNTSIQAGALATSGVNVYIDGVSQKDYVTGGGITGQAGASNSGDPGNPFPQLAIGEYKVITSNFNAEYDQLSSAVITAQTKSGTNVLHAEGFGDYTSDHYRAETPAEEAANKKSKSPNKEYGFAVGGPIIQNALHYFGTWEHKDFTLPQTVNPPGLVGNPPIGTLLPAGVFSQFGPSTNPFQENLYFGKLDWEPTDADRLELSLKIRHETQVQGANGQIASSAAFNFANQDNRGWLRWERSGDRWINEARASYEKTIDNPTPINANIPASTYTLFGYGSPTDLITINGQDPRQYTDKHQRGVGLQDDFTLTNIHWVTGDHTLKMGAKFKTVQLVARDASTAAKYWYAVTSSGTSAIPYQVVFGKVNPGFTPTATSDNRQFGVYFQDDWTVNRKTTFNLGLRWDYERTPSYLDYQTPAAIVAALTGPYPAVSDPTLPQPTPGETYAQALARGGININDYISNGHNRSAYTSEFQPRLGFSIDLNEDQRHVVHGGIGRSYDRNLFNILQLEVTKTALSEPTVNFYNAGASLNHCNTPADASPTCIAWNPSYLNPANLQALAPGQLGEVNMLPNSLKVPYSDQFSLGIRNRLGDWNTDVTVTRVNSYDGILGSLGNRYADGSFAAHSCGLAWGGSPAQWCSSGPPGFAGNLVLFSNGQKSRNTEFLVYAQKPYTAETHWGSTFAYTYSSASQNRLVFGGYSAFSDGYAFDLPVIGDYPYLASQIPKHRLVATGSLGGWWGVVFAAKGTVASPQPFSSILGCGQLGFPNGTSCNAFGTNAYPGSASFNSKIGYKALDLEATKHFEFAGSGDVWARLDILNVTNARNFDPTQASWNYPMAPQYNPTGPIIGVPRTLKLTLGAKW